MIYTDPTEVLKEAGFTPQNFHLHPLYHSPANYVPIWHHVDGESDLESESEYKVTEVLK